MAINEKLDNPKTTGWRGFAREAWAETMHNKRFRIGARADRNGAGTKTALTTNQKINNTANTIQGVSIGTLVFSLSFLAHDMYQVQNSVNVAATTIAEAIEDTDAVNGIVGNKDVLALRQGDEFALFSSAAKGPSDARYVYTPNAEGALALSQEQIKHYEALLAILPLEQQHGVDIEFNNASYQMDFGSMSAPYTLDQRETISLYLENIQQSDSIMDAAQLESQLSDWRTVEASIMDGGYGIQQDSVFVEDTVNTNINETGYGAAQVGKGMAAYLSLMLIGGMGIAGAKRGSQSMRKKPSSKPKSGMRDSKFSKNNDTNYAGPL